MGGVGTPGVPFLGRASGACRGLVRKCVYFSMSDLLRGSWVRRSGQREGQCKGPEVGLILRAYSFSSLHPCPHTPPHYQCGAWQAVGVEWIQPLLCLNWGGEAGAEHVGGVGEHVLFRLVRDVNPQAHAGRRVPVTLSAARLGVGGAQVGSTFSF